MFGFSMQQLDCELEISIAHRNREQIINLIFWYKSASRSKLYLNSPHRDIINVKKRPPVHKQANITRLLAIYNRIDNAQRSQ